MNNLNGFQQIGNNLHQRNQQLFPRQQLNGTNPQLQQQLMMQQIMMQRQMLGQPLGQTKPFLTTEDRLNVLMNLKAVTRQPNMDESQLTQATLNLEKQIHDAASSREAYAHQVNSQIMARRQTPSMLQQIQLLIQQQYPHLPPQQQAQLVMQFQQKQQQLMMQMRQQNQQLNTPNPTKEPVEKNQKENDGLTIALQAETLSVEDQQQVITKMREISALFPHIESWLQIIQAKADGQLTAKLTGMKKLAEAQWDGLKQKPPVFYLSVENVVKLQNGLLRFNAYMQQLRQMPPPMNNQMMNVMSPRMNSQMMNSPMINAMSLSNQMMNGMSPPMINQMMNASTQQLSASPSMQKGQMNVSTKNQVSSAQPVTCQSMMMTNQAMNNALHKSPMINNATIDNGVSSSPGNVASSMQVQTKTNSAIPSPPKPSPRITPNQCSPNMNGSIMTPNVPVNNPSYFQNFLQSLQMRNHSLRQQLQQLIAQQQQYQISGLPPQQIQQLLVENQNEQTKVRMLMNQIQMQWNQTIQSQDQMKKPVTNEKEDFWNDLFSVETPVEPTEPIQAVEPTEKPKPKEEVEEEEVNFDSLFDFNYSPTSVKRPREEEDCLDLFVDEERNVKSKIDNEETKKVVDEKTFFGIANGLLEDDEVTNSKEETFFDIGDGLIKDDEKTISKEISNESDNDFTEKSTKETPANSNQKSIKLNQDFTKDVKLIINELNASKNQLKFTTETKEKENKLIINCSLDKTIKLHLSNTKNLLSFADTKFGLELVECDDLTIEQQVLEKVKELRERVRVTHVLQLVESVLTKT